MTPAYGTTAPQPGRCKARCRNVAVLLFVLGFACLGLRQTARAQEALANSVSQQEQNFSQKPGSAENSTVNRMFLPGGTPVGATESDEDLGEQWVFKRNERPKYLTLSADASEFYTSNVALAHGTGRGDFFSVIDIAAVYARPFARDFSWHASVSESLFRYNRFNALDFDGLNAGVGINWQARALAGINFSLDYNYSHLTRGGTFEELFTNHSFTLAGSKAFQFTTADSLTFGAALDYNLADPTSLARADLAVFAGYNLNLTRALAVSLNYRVAGEDYVDADRRDLSQTLTAGLRWNVARWFAVNLSASGGYNGSNETAFSYRVLNLGGGLSGSVQF